MEYTINPRLSKEGMFRGRGKKRLTPKVRRCPGNAFLFSIIIPQFSRNTMLWRPDLIPPNILRPEAPLRLSAF